MQRRESSGRIRKESLKKFSELIRKLELMDIVCESQTFKRYSWKATKETEVDIKFDSKLISADLTEDILHTKTEFKVTMKEKEDRIFVFTTTYFMKFKNNEPDKTKELLSNQEVSNLFFKRQLPKIAWTYLRTDYSQALAKAAIRPITLPLLK